LRAILICPEPGACSRAILICLEVGACLRAIQNVIQDRIQDVVRRRNIKSPYKIARKQAPTKNGVRLILNDQGHYLIKKSGLLGFGRPNLNTKKGRPIESVALELKPHCSITGKEERSWRLRC